MNLDDELIAVSTRDLAHVFSLLIVRCMYVAKLTLIMGILLYYILPSGKSFNMNLSICNMNLTLWKFLHGRTKFYLALKRIVRFSSQYILLIPETLLYFG